MIFDHERNAVWTGLMLRMRSTMLCLLALLIAGLGVTSSRVHASPNEGSTHISPSAPVRHGTRVVVRNLDAVSPSRLFWACETVWAAFAIPCEVQIQPATTSAERIDARRFLEARFETDAKSLHPTQLTPNAATIELWLTQADIFEGRRPFVFGIASVTDRIALISMHRIASLHATTEKHRLEKLVVHELSHTLGLAHHEDPDCAMRVEPSLERLDHASDRPCERCQQQLLAQIHDTDRAGQYHLDRVQGFLVRAQFDAAIALAKVLATHDQVDPSIRVESIRALSRATQYRVAAQGQIE